MFSTGGGRAATASPVASARGRLTAPARPSACAWIAVAVVAAFVAVTAWWLSVDRSVQYNDAAQHLFFAFSFREALNDGHLLTAIGYGNFYPPATYLLGAFSTLVGGVSVATPILAQNLVYAPLLALACYRLGRMTSAPRAPLGGLLAVVFALGAPLIVEQFHVFMLDIPQAALIAVAIWLLLASERFARVGIAALAGLAFGLSIVTKELAPVYVLGVLACVLVRGGGWRNWRGWLAFGGVAFVVGMPWYIRQAALGHAGLLFEAAGGGRDVPPAASPAVLSVSNALWYFWATLNGLLFAPLFAFAAIGVGAAVVRVARTRDADDPTLELLVGLGVAWLLLTLMAHHDMRYTIGLIVYLAVLGTAWIVRLEAAPRTLAIGLLVGATCLAQMGATLGIGGDATHRLPGNRRALYGEGVPPRGRVIVYASSDFMVSGPKSRPDLLGFFGALKREGVTTVGWDDQVEQWDPWFEGIGLIAFAYVAGLAVTPEDERTPDVQPGQALLIRARSLGGAGPACVRLPDGSGVWARIALAGQEAQSRCPAGSPQAFS